MDTLCAAANKLGSEGAKALNPSLSESPSKLSHQASTTCLRGTGKAGLSVLAPVSPSLFPKAHCTSKSHTPCMLQLNLMFQKALWADHEFERAVGQVACSLKHTAQLHLT